MNINWTGFDMTVEDIVMCYVKAVRSSNQTEIDFLEGKYKCQEWDKRSIRLILVQIENRNWYAKQDRIHRTLSR